MPPTYAHVLAVDDDPILLQVLSAFFAKHGITASTAPDGAAAVKMVNERDDIDLIVTDLQMPDTDGIEFLAHLKDKASTIPVVVISSAGSTMILSAEALAKAYQLNFLGALRKPVNFQELAKLLELPETN
ncbi:MAG: response regulator [Hyphomicrobiaceae bacterium]